jgi:hypothetical protein
VRLWSSDGFGLPSQVVFNREAHEWAEMLCQHPGSMDDCIAHAQSAVKKSDEAIEQKRQWQERRVLARINNAARRGGGSLLAGAGQRGAFGWNARNHGDLTDAEVDKLLSTVGPEDAENGDVP